MKKPKLDPWFCPEASEKLRSLRPIFLRLPRIHERYNRTEKPDFSYWYREPTQVGLLASAAILAGKTALEEYHVEKTAEGIPQKACRGDLFIRTSGSTSFECEAKWVPVDLGNRITELMKRIDDAMGKASDEVQQHNNTDQHQQLGLCFVTPWMSQKTNKSKLKERRRQLIKKLKGANGKRHCDALLWIGGKALPDASRSYPGLLLLVKEVKSQPWGGGEENGNSGLRKKSA